MSDHTGAPTDAAVLVEAAEWRRAGHAVALATVIATWGSSPRPIGSKLAVDAAGRMAGSVSGGCVEAEVVAVALEVMAAGQPRTLTFGVSDETALGAGLACGGTIAVFVEALQ